jgi:hypothetical protein
VRFRFLGDRPHEVPQQIALALNMPERRRPIHVREDMQDYRLTADDPVVRQEIDKRSVQNVTVGVAFGGSGRSLVAGSSLSIGRRAAQAFSCAILHNA